MAGPKLRFSIQIPVTSNSTSWLAKARRAEDGGFYSLSVPDHLGQSLPQLAPLIALAAVISGTSTLRLATTVLNNDFRHPVMVAKEVGTLDLLSSGRVDLGIGAGWLEQDYQTGIANWDRPGVRVSRLFESIELLYQLLSGQMTTFRGSYYQLSDFRSTPPAVQHPIPLLIGGREKRMLTFAAERAQIASILAATTPDGNTRAGFEKQLGWIEEAGGKVRRDLTIGLRIPLGRIAGRGESNHEILSGLAQLTGLAVKDVVASPFVLGGDIALVRSKLQELAELYGIGYITVNEQVGWDIEDLVSEMAA